MAFVWGGVSLSVAFGWLWWTGSYATFLTMPGKIFPLAVVTLLMGMFSSCWLTQRRPGWPAIREPVHLARGLICLTLGLTVAWIIPTRAGLIEIVLLLPLFCIDLIPTDRSTFPAQGGRVDDLLERSAGDPAAWLPPLLSCGSSPWWWVVYLVRRRFLFPTALATCLTIVTGAIWSSVPTPFAAHLVGMHQGQTLIWLVAGQLSALVLGAYLFSKSRNCVGLPDRLIPPTWQKRCWLLARISLLLIAGSLMLLGLPLLQASWWLASSLGLYTITGATWGLLLSRLRPSIRTEQYALRHLYLGTGQAESLGRLVYEQTLETQAFLALNTWEGIVTAVLIPLCGMLIDHRTFDTMLVIGGLTLFCLLTMVVSTHALLTTQQQANHLSVKERKQVYPVVS
jgi:hypothetical protein